MVSHADYTAWISILSFNALFAGVAWVLNMRNCFAIAEHPTSTIAAAAQGYVELHGRTLAPTLTKSPISGTACVWYRCWIYAQSPWPLWRLVSYQSSSKPFILADATGQCLIDPTGAEMLASYRFRRTQDGHCYIEEVLAVDQAIYALGQLKTNRESPESPFVRQGVSRLLGQWKRWPARLLQRYDIDRNGELDIKEWEMAREHALQEVLASQQIHDGQESGLTDPDDGRLFLIAGVPAHVIAQRYSRWAWMHFICLGSWLVAIVSLQSRIGGGV